jgi:transposase
MGISNRRRYRSWPEALKREIVAATRVPGASVSVVARYYDVNANQVFAWRRRYGPGLAEPTALRLTPVTVTPDQPIAPGQSNELIEIELSGARVRIPISTPPTLAAAVVGALR